MLLTSPASRMPLAAQTIIPGDITPAHLRGAWSGATLSSLHGHTMGTYWNFCWQDSKIHTPATVHAALQRAFDLVITQMSHYDPASELSRINQSSPHKPHLISEDFFHVLKQALTLSEQTQGAYNPNLAALSSSYGFGPDPGGILPTLSSFSEPWKHLHLDSHHRTLTHDLERLDLDLSSIAKGYALDVAARELKALGVNDYLLEIGGEFLARGCKPDAQPWWIELPSPAPLSRLRFALTHHALATSGIEAEAKNPQSLHHLLAPHQARPTQHSLLTVTVLADTCFHADAWATALYILGLEKGLAFAAEHRICAVFTSSQSHHFSALMEAMQSEE